MPREKLGRLRRRASIWKVHDCEAERQLASGPFFFAYWWSRLDGDSVR